MPASTFLDMTKKHKKINILHVSEHEGEDALEVNALLMQKDMKSHYCYVKSLSALHRKQQPHAHRNAGKGQKHVEVPTLKPAGASALGNVLRLRVNHKKARNMHQ